MDDLARMGGAQRFAEVLNKRRQVLVAIAGSVKNDNAERGSG
jgi:hypothetical protein